VAIFARGRNHEPSSIRINKKIASLKRNMIHWGCPNKDSFGKINTKLPFALSIEGGIYFDGKNPYIIGVCPMSDRVKIG
jgi:hypothetical protein